jgi:hypothetical protein
MEQSESNSCSNSTTTEVLGLYPNKWQRKFLAAKWQQLNAEEKLVLRASRSKRGIKCYMCGSPGVFRENCPNGCQSPGATPRNRDSDDSDTEEKTPRQERTANQPSPSKEIAALETTPLDSSANQCTAFWGAAAASNAQQEAPLTIYQMKQKLDFVKLRVESTTLKSSMRKEDKKTTQEGYAFFSEAKETYARNAAELTLHQLMRRMMRLVEKELLQNAEKLESKFDTTLLVAPFQKEGKTFYPEEFLKNAEYREYIFKKTANKGIKKAHQNQATLRPNDDLDAVFRGQSANTDYLYKTKPNAGESIHAKNTWKSIYGRYDGLANSDPSLAAKQQKLDKIFHEQGQWIRLQKQNMEFRNDRFEHLVFILRREMEKEHARETKVLLTDSGVHGNAEKDNAVDVFQDRLQAVDLMTHVLETYRFTAGGEEADFLLYCMQQWQEIMKKSKVLGIRQSQVRRVGKKNRNARQQLSGGSAMNGCNLEDSSDLEDDDNNAKEPSQENSDSFLRELQNATVAEKKQKAALEQKRKAHHQQAKQQAGMRDLVAANNPYHQDIVFLEMLKKKEDRLYEKSKTATAFSAQGQREADAEMERKRHERKQALENMTISTPHATMRNETNHGEKSGSSSLPSMDDIMSMAKAHSEGVAARDERIRLQQLRMQERTKPHDPKVAHHFTHPRDVDAQRIAQREAAFKHAELGNRIRKGNDDDHAHALPALIPIPQAFDGNSQSISHTAQNIIYGLKKEMVLSDLGYTPQTTVPLYVRTTLVEKEGTSKNGDPTQEELSYDRRYSHYLGRPLIRFNNPATTAPPPSTHSTQMAITDIIPGNNNAAAIDRFLIEDLTALQFPSSPSASFTASIKGREQHHHSPISKDMDSVHSGFSSATSHVSAFAKDNPISNTSPLRVSNSSRSLLSNQTHPSCSPLYPSSSTKSLTSVSSTSSKGYRGPKYIVASENGPDSELTDAQKRKAEEKQRFGNKYNPLTKSLVRLVFSNPQPMLDDLKYLDDF